MAQKRHPSWDKYSRVADDLEKYAKAHPPWDSHNPILSQYNQVIKGQYYKNYALNLNTTLPSTYLVSSGVSFSFKADSVAFEKTMAEVEKNIKSLEVAIKDYGITVEDFKQSTNLIAKGNAITISGTFKPIGSQGKDGSAEVK